MKRWLGVLAIALLFCGCSNAAPQDNNEPKPLPQIPGITAPALYDSQNPVEDATKGAVKAYSPNNGDCTYIAPMGKNVLLFADEGIGLYRGERLTEVASAQISDLPLPNSGMLQIREEGIAYYNAKENQIVFLNQFLRQIGTFSLTEDITGDVYLAPDWKMFYYCSDAGVHVLNLDTGVSRLLKAQDANWQGVNGGFLNGTVLRCVRRDGNKDTVMLLSAETGTVLAEADYLNSMLGDGDSYYLTVNQEYVFGVGDELPVHILPQGRGKLYPFPEDRCAVFVKKAKTSCQLDHYDVDTGKRTASIKLQDFKKIDSIYCLNGAVFFTVDDALYRWDPKQSPVEDETNYTEPHYHYRQPDTQGLATIEHKVRRLEERYGVQILYWDEVEGLAPWNYSFVPEHLSEAYTEYLSVLAKTMAKFPDGFFEQAAAWTNSQKLNILLVRGIYGGVETEKYTSAPGIQFNANGDTYIALAVDENLEEWFYHEMGHLVDNRVLSTTNAYSNWSSLNPWDFKYDNDYVKNQDRTDSKYLEGEQRHFVDLYSMSFALEDRSRIFEYACMPGNEEIFASKPMQRKLKSICNGIRKAFDLEDESYIWEQYLEE